MRSGPGAAPRTALSRCRQRGRRLPRRRSAWRPLEHPAPDHHASLDPDCAVPDAALHGRRRYGRPPVGGRIVGRAVVEGAPGPAAISAGLAAEDDHPRARPHRRVVGPAGERRRSQSPPGGRWHLQDGPVVLGAAAPDDHPVLGCDERHTRPVAQPGGRQWRPDRGDLTAPIVAARRTEKEDSCDHQPQHGPEGQPRLPLGPPPPGSGGAATLTASALPPPACSSHEMPRAVRTAQSAQTAVPHVLQLKLVSTRCCVQVSIREIIALTRGAAWVRTFAYSP